MSRLFAGNLEISFATGTGRSEIAEANNSNTTGLPLMPSFCTIEG